MFGYFVWEPEGRPRILLRPAEIAGVTFLALEARGGEKRLGRRMDRALAAVERAGIRRCVMPENWPASWRRELLPVEEAGLRQAVFPRLLERFCRERRLEPDKSAAMLSAPFVSRAVWEAADLLARRSRYLILSVEGGGALSRELLRRYGVSPVTAGRRPAFQVCFGEPAAPVPALLLGSGCGRRQTVTYRLPARLEEALASRDVPAQLVAALWESGAVETREIGVVSLGFPA